MIASLALALLLSAALNAAEGGAVAASPTASVTAEAGATSYEKDGTVYAVGEVIRVKGSRREAEKKALKDAAARLAEALEKKGLGGKKEIARGVENAVLLETPVRSYKLGKVVVESAYQERWEAPDGKEAWNAKMVISIRRR